MKTCKITREHWLLLLTVINLALLPRAETRLAAESITLADGYSLTRIQVMDLRSPTESLTNPTISYWRIVDEINYVSPTAPLAQVQVADYVLVRLKPGIAIDQFVDEALTPSGLSLYANQVIEASKRSYKIAVEDPLDPVAVPDLLLFLNRHFVPRYISEARPDGFIWGGREIGSVQQPRRLSPFFLFEHQGDGWRETWMGWVNDYQGFNPYFAHNWIYTLRYGWIWGVYPENQTGWDSIWFYADEWGWFQTGPSTYPWAWFLEEGSWKQLDTQ